MRTSLSIVLILLLGVAAPLWWSPYSQAARIALAIAERDATVLERAVDLQRLQHRVAVHTRSNYSVRISPALQANSQLRQTFEALAQQGIREEVQRRTRPEQVLQLVQRALGQESPGTRFERAVRLLRSDALVWRDLNSVYVGDAQDVRVLMTRSGLMWRIVGMQFAEPKVPRLELRTDG
jgi:hypothetical protein